VRCAQICEKTKRPYVGLCRNSEGEKPKIECQWAEEFTLFFKGIAHGDRKYPTEVFSKSQIG
jgi:hypothetical protein